MKHCKHCEQEIYGAKGNWWHKYSDSMKCEVIAEPMGEEYVYTVEQRHNKDSSCGDDVLVMHVASTEEKAWQWARDHEDADSDWQWWWFEICQYNVDNNGASVLGCYYPLREQRFKQ